MDSLVDTVRRLFSDSGPVSHIEGFDYRPQQQEMAAEVASALETDGHLIIEAPTGVGKTLAYVIPSLLFALEHGRTAIVSTHTKNLQEQLLLRDIPRTTGLIGTAPRAVALKGRRNYLCATRLQNALRADPRIVPVADPGELSALERWSRSTSDGEFDHLPFVPRPETWDLVCSEPGACSTAACGRRCFYQRARERARAAHLVVMNHALLFTLMRLQGTDERFIFDNDFVVCDEAHTLEPVAAAGAGCRLSRASILRSVHRLYDPSTERGILAARKRSFRTLCRTVQGEVEEFFGAVLAAARQQTPGRTSDGARDLTLIRIRSRLAIENTLDGRLAELEQRTHRLEEASGDLFAAQELTLIRRSLIEARGGVAAFLSQEAAGWTHWIEVAPGTRANIVLCSSPTDIAETVGPALFREGSPVVLTSGTLSVGGSLDYIRRRLGAHDARLVMLDSPFDYVRQMRISVARDIAQPDSEAYVRELPAWVLRSIRRTDGRALVLFTNAATMRSVADALASILRTAGIRLLVQGSDLQRHELLEQFRADERSVLFGLESFWAGIDAPGDTLSQVIITRLPFAVPSHPLMEARLEALASRGDNPFLEYTLPEAILKFRQGVGRLIRSSADRGLVTLLDSRILNKSYGNVFFASLPRCPVELVSSRGEVEEVDRADW